MIESNVKISLNSPWEESTDCFIIRIDDNQGDQTYKTYYFSSVDKMRGFVSGFSEERLKTILQVQGVIAKLSEDILQVQGVIAKLSEENLRLRYEEFIAERDPEKQSCAEAGSIKVV